MSLEHRTPILVLGITAAGPDGLPPALQERVRRAALLVGGRRHLAAFPDAPGERLAITGALGPVIQRLARAWEAGEQAVVLASGDPLLYGMGATLRRHLSPEALEIVPAPSAFQLAFAALGEPWHDARLLSAHGRPLSPVIAAARQAAKAAILTDSRHTPAAIAQALLETGLSPETPAAIAEELGGPEQRVRRMTLGAASQTPARPLNVFLVWPGQALPEPVPPGLPDQAFATTGRQITKREVRLLSLAELALGPGEVLWDLGAGSGAVGIEAARSQPTARVHAVERRAQFCQHIRENLRRFPAPNLRLIQGLAPEACQGLPDPDAVFLGGSGGRLAAILDEVIRRLHLGGRLVVNLATLESLATVRARLPDARVTQLQFSRGVDIQGKLRLAPLNPVFMAVWRKEGR